MFYSEDLSKLIVRSQTTVYRVRRVRIESGGQSVSFGKCLQQAVWIIIYCLPSLALHNKRGKPKVCKTLLLPLMFLALSDIFLAMVTHCKISAVAVLSYY